jgi:predicted MFS family arabinose efflux permease
MQNLMRNRPETARIWTVNLIRLASVVFLVRCGQGLLTGVSTNFFVDVLGLSGKQVLWVNGMREIPGLCLMFVAALIMRLPLARRAALALFFMGLGYGLYAMVQSYTALIGVVIFASLGFHNWGPLNNSLGLSLTTKENSGRVLGSLASVGSLASIVGMGLIALLSTQLPLRAFNALGGVLMILGAVLVFQLPTNIGETKKAQRRMLLKRRYWLYYVLICFEGCRTQVFGSFGTLVLVQNYGLQAAEISLLLLLSAVVNFLLVPRLGNLIDRLGERRILAGGYVAMAFCFAIYATMRNVWFLGAALIGINFLLTLSMGLSTYVNRIAPAEELTPTLTAGVSFNHITSVMMSFLAGALLSLIGYQALCWAAAGIIMLSVPFALAIQVRAPAAPQAAPVAAE